VTVHDFGVDYTLSKNISIPLSIPLILVLIDFSVRFGRGGVICSARECETEGSSYSCFSAMVQ
jgi:hypothetical protein